MLLQGSITALATPFTSDGIDEARFEAFVDWQIDQGTNGLLACGTTGEASTLTPGERYRLIRVCVERAAGCIPVIAGTGTNSTETTIELTRAAKAAGADAALIVTPYYSRPSQEGLFRHFAAVAAAVDLPIVLYNVPKRTGVDLHFSIVERLAEIPSIIGIEDASDDLDRPRVTALVAGPRFAQLCGNDASAVTFNLAGGRGCVSVLANVVPSLCRDLHHACRTQDWAGARTLQNRMRPLIDALGREPNPGPVKQALAFVQPGFSRELRLPMVGVAASTAAEIRNALDELGVLGGDPPGPVASQENARRTCAAAAVPVLPAGHSPGSDIPVS